MIVNFNLNSVSDYQKFLAVKRLPVYKIQGRCAWFPDEYASRLGFANTNGKDKSRYTPIDGMFDYQKAITKMAIEKQKFAVFAECGLGKTLIMLEFARHVESVCKGPKLIVSPLMVIRQTLEECRRWYGDDLTIQQIASKDLQSFLSSGSGLGITNYDAIKDDLNGRRLQMLALDESSMLKSHYGKWGTKLIDMGRGVKWKLSLTGTPAPNDRIEYANQAVFVDMARTTNEFLARYFVNRGQTQERWVMKPHAVKPFYRFLSHWCVFLNNPKTYGWKDNCQDLPPIKINIEHVDLTREQTEAITNETGMMFATNPGGIVQRSKLARIAKGKLGGADISSNKPEHIKRSIDSWSQVEQTIVWCRYNDEQDQLAKHLRCESISGSTPLPEREKIIEGLKNGHVRTIVTKPKILGFGLNLHMVTRQVFSTLQDSYEEFHQAVKRSNRYGAQRALNVHIPVTSAEEPMVENVLRKASMVQRDTEEQERLFKELMQ